MHGKIHSVLFCIFFFMIFFSISEQVLANEGEPSAGTAVPTQISQGNAPGEANAIAMDPSARIVLPTDSFDFGSIYEGNDIFHDFIIKNEGTADLKIIDVKSG